MYKCAHKKYIRARDTYMRAKYQPSTPHTQYVQYNGVRVMATVLNCGKPQLSTRFDAYSTDTQ